MEPAPVGAPSYVCFMVGSSLAHGDQLSQLWKSFTCAKAAVGGACMVAERVMQKSAGRVATNATIAAMTTAIPIRMYQSISIPSSYELIKGDKCSCGCRPSAHANVSVVVMHRS